VNRGLGGEAAGWARRHRVGLAWGAVLVALLLGLHWARRQPTLLRAVWPPADLYEPLLVQPFDASLPGRVEYVFRPRYAGSHAVLLRTARASDVRIAKPRMLDLRIVLTSPSGVAREYETAGGRASRYGTSKRGPGGFILAWFDVPEEAPEAPIRLAVEAATGDVDFHRAHCPCELEVSKMSDL
jgi:hypothetical protein